MHVSERIAALAAAALIVLTVLPVSAAKKPKSGDGMNMFDKSDFIEKEQPELTAETKKLISLYKRKPTAENYLNLRAEVIKNYDAVLDRKEAKLAALKEETAGKPGGLAKVAEMEEIVQEMYRTYWNRINSSMLRFTDPRLLSWKVADAYLYDYIPVMGAGTTVYVGRTQVTNAQYAAFVAATGHSAPAGWTDGSYPAGEEELPVNYVSVADAEAYCAWLTACDGVNTYRLPNESEWELAAGHMPKDADFNCGVSDGRTPVETYAKVTRGAHGAVDFWGNVWEWTTTARADGTRGVKGGAWNSARTDCRTEYRKEGRDGTAGYADVGFRVLQILNGEEPEQKVELATLASPATVSAVSLSSDSIGLHWTAVDGAEAYQIFIYDADTDHVEMLWTTTETSVSFGGLEPGSTHRYIVQPISFVEIADNVSGENSVGAACGDAPASAVQPAVAYDAASNSLPLSWQTAAGKDAYYIYRYHPDADMISTPKTVSGTTAYTYRRETFEREVSFLVTAEPMQSRKYYYGGGAVTVIFPGD